MRIADAGEVVRVNVQAAVSTGFFLCRADLLGYEF
tara:strand:+ start:360 stop:464 length:105 start_codon:yes stop_codon:yes gene_type:complete